ncbi:ATP-grasp domain-containing protein [Alkalibacterium olivapovliticus]|uniref:RimK-like ATP-grasp domain-containing protein n=1 Tax=Alkalibacterium olivapovliticus TaxID=99907 RepID=A0A2T0WA84_9LACT|nr:alpha-L-glutamate ligase [Alkalibacterium olivapovliticus]PRY83619.1 RimK-like ATP-grasp domain-containing protein [Alkalibacterium olivapovliticus]
MSKVIILHENMDWTKHLIKRLEELDVPYEEWDLSDGILDIQDLPEDGIYYNRMSASSHTRGHRYAPELTDQVLTWLEQKGARVINGTGAIELEVSKLKQYLALQADGIKTPKTIGAVGAENIIKAAEKLNEFPFIIKHNRAGKGLGVRLLYTLDELKDYVNGPEFEDSIDGLSLIQQYIKSEDGHIVRSEFIGGEYFYAVKVDSSEGFELCPADACQIGPDGEMITEESKFKIIDRLPEDQISRYLTFMKHQNIDVAALEFIIDEKGEVYTYDVNTNTNYNEDAEKEAGQFAMLELAKYLKAELKKIAKVNV